MRTIVLNALKANLGVDKQPWILHTTIGKCSVYSNRPLTSLVGTKQAYLESSLKYLTNQVNSNNMFISDFNLRMTLLAYIFSQTEQF